MQVVHVLRAFALAFAGVGAFVVFSGFKLKYYGVLGPGPGFFPIWLGSILVAACLFLFFHSFFVHAEPEAFFSSRDAAIRVLVVVLSLVAIWLALHYLGFRLAVLLFALFVPRILGGRSLVVTVGLALMVSFGVGFAFETWLGVSLPEPAFEALRSLGF